MKLFKDIAISVFFGSVWFLTIWLLSGCSSLTVAPEPVEAKVVALDGNQPTAGILAANANGVAVTPHYIYSYNYLADKSKLYAPIQPSANVTAPQIITGEEAANYEALKRWAHANGVTVP